jgi:PAS domain S-box-containing protein
LETVGTASPVENRLIKYIPSPKVSIGFVAALLVLVVHVISGYQNISKITDNNQSIAEINQLRIGLDRSEQQVLDRLQADSRRSLTEAKFALVISGLLDLLLLGFLYGLVNWDLTRKQQAESILRDYVAEFEELYHHAPCGYHSLDPTGKFLRINHTELQMLGYTEAEIIGHKSLIDLLTPASIQIFNDNFPIVKTRGWIHDLELEMLRKDGQIVPISATMVAIKDDQGNYLSDRSTVIDISDRVRLRKQARLSAEISQKIRQSLQLDEILATAVEEVQQLLGVDRVLIFRLEPDGTGMVVQERVLSGYPAVMGSNIVDPCFVGAASLRRQTLLFSSRGCANETLREREQNENRSYHASYAQGRIYTVADITQAGFTPCYVEFLQKFAVKASSIVPIHLREELWGLLIVHHCQAPRQWQPKEIEIMLQLATQIGIALTQAQLLEQEQIQRQELARSNAELAQFAHIASHDLQEPLRMVIGYLQLLERRYKGKLDLDADEFIGYAVDGAMRMQALIQALLSYARVSSRKQPFDLVKCDLVLQDAISNLHVAIGESGAIISADPLPEVWGDATQLTQVLQNLIANAIKFCTAIPPRIQISVQRLDPRSDPHSSSGEIAATQANWQFAVADNGIGIEPQYLDRIFVIFQRLHSRATYPGTGIGLAICKKIIERHGGTIWVESIPMQSDSVLQQPLPAQPECYGSIFYFTIPVAGSISPDHAHKQPHP